MSLKDWMKKVETAQLSEATQMGQFTIKSQSEMPKTPQTSTGQMQQGQMNNNAKIVTKGNQVVGSFKDDKSAQEFINTNRNGQQGQQSSQQPITVHEDGMEESKSTVKSNPGLDYIRNNHKHECKAFEEGWGMHESLYSALRDHYCDEGRVPKNLILEGGQSLRDFVESCYAEDIGLGGNDNQDAINNGMLDETESEPSAEVADEFIRLVNARHPEAGGRIRLVSVSDNDNQMSAQVPGQDRSYGFIDMTSGHTEFLDEEYMNDMEEGMSSLERRIKQTEENTMYESKNTRSVREATEKTKTGLKHKADAGGYGRKDDEEDTDEDGKKIKKAKKDEPKKGRGRPKKTDNTSGEDKKFDFSALSKVSGSKAPKTDKWDKKKTTKVTKMKDGDKNDKEELDEEKLTGKNKKFAALAEPKDKITFADKIAGAKKKDLQMESWDKQLKTLLSEGLTVSTSVGNEGGQDSVSITASDTDAHQLLQMLQNAGMGTGMPAHAIQATTAPATVLPKASPSTVGSIANTDGAPNASAQKDINGGGDSVPIMAMPRGMAFSVSDESEMPTEPEEFGTLDQEEVVKALGSEHGSADDNGDGALAAIKKLMGAHGGSEVDAAKATSPESSTSTEVSTDVREEEVEESDEDGKKPDFLDLDKDGDKKEPMKQATNTDDSEEESEDDEEDVKEGTGLAAPTANEIEKGRQMKEGKDTCNECGGLMEDDHECDGQLNEWSNSPQGQSEDEQFESDIAFMTKVLAGGVNGPKSTGQATTPVLASQTNRQMSEGYNIDVAAEMRKLAGIR